MDENNTASVPQTETVVVPETTSEETVETLEEVKAQYEAERQARLKAEELANNQKIRAEKAEGEAKKTRGTTKETPVAHVKGNDMSFRDTVAIVKANVPEEDLDEVLDYAKFKGVSIVDALKSDTIKATLSLRAEQRNTASATHVGSARRGAVKISDEALVSNAEKGNIPESDDEITRLLKIKMGVKR